MAGHNLQDERVRTADVEFDPSLRFEQMFLSEAVVRGLTRNNFVRPSPIQARAIPLGKLGLGAELGSVLLLFWVVIDFSFFFR